MIIRSDMSFGYLQFLDFHNELASGSGNSLSLIALYISKSLYIWKS